MGSNREWKKKRGNDLINDVREFVTDAGTIVQLRWKENEYRAFYAASRNNFVPMNLGSTNPDPLIEYIKRRF